MCGQHDLNAYTLKKIKYDIYIYIHFFRLSHHFFFNFSNFYFI